MKDCQRNATSPNIDPKPPNQFFTQKRPQDLETF
jgi:hypothetical protein